MGPRGIATAIQTRPRQARLGVTLMFLANGSGIGAWAASIPGVKDGLDLSASALGSALLAFGLGAMVAMPVAGWFGARGLPHLLTGTGVLTAVTLALPGLAAGAGTLALSLLLFGAFNGAMDVCMNARATEVEKDSGRAIMSSFHAAFSLGELLGAGVGAWARVAGWSVEAGLLLDAALILAAVAAHAVLDPTEPHAAPASTGGLHWPGWRLVSIGLLCLLAFMSEGANVDWSGVFLQQVAGFSGAAATSGLAGFCVAMIAGRLGGDWAVRRLGPGRVLRLGSALAAAGFALVAAVPWAGPLGFAMVGLGVANMAPVLFTAAGRAGRDASTGVAMVATLGYSGLLMGPPVIGFLADQVGLRAAFLLLVAAAAAVGLCARRAEGA